LTKSYITYKIVLIIKKIEIFFLIFNFLISNLEKCDLTIPGKSIQTALTAGSLLACTSAFLDAGGSTTRVDNGKEYYAYTTEKRPNVN
jgi:hypothetical protein